MFYAAVILEGLDYMHLQNIVYRDLKPENVLLDADGYCVVVDLGFAKEVKDKTYTLCGTPLYIAPEVILSKGHNKAADIWSLGVLIYEMVYGVTPFYVDGIDQMGLFKSVVRGNVKFPPRSDKDVNDLVTRMLHRRAAYRLGCLKDGAQDIRDHAFFSGIDFAALNSKTMKSPWKPKLKDPFDTKHFDDWSHLEKEVDLSIHFRSATVDIVVESFSFRGICNTTASAISILNPGHSTTAFGYTLNCAIIY